MKTKNLILLIIYIVILVLQITMFSLDEYIVVNFYPNKLLNKLLGKTEDEYISDVKILVDDIIDENQSLSNEQKIIAKQQLFSPIKDKLKSYIKNFYIIFTLGLLKGCATTSQDINKLNLEDDPVINKFNIDTTQIQRRLDKEFYPIFKCYNYDSPELLSAFGDIGNYMKYVRTVIIFLFVAISFIILIVFAKLLRGKKLRIFTFIKNILGFFVGIVFTILFSLFFFLPLIIKNLNVSLSEYGINDFDNTSILRVKNWGPSFQILIAIVIITLIKTIFV